MTEQELNISKLSYVNKDFASIYPDLLDLVKTLTNRWDPSSSNESDPGVVLLKVGAFLADHLNYNIDKNILEAFLSSATQEESVRRIAEFGGYTPRYYRSAKGNVSISYNPDVFEGQFSVPAFSVVITNDDGSITYTQTSDFVISGKNIPANVEFMEGVVQRLSVESNIITLNNINNFNRIYFPTKFVAENGVYIYNVNADGIRTESNPWRKVDYIYSVPLGTKCYKIDYDSQRSLPYIEFPTDIASLIEDGLAIYYFYTSGSYGNVKAKELNTISSFSTSSLASEYAINAANNTDAFIVSNLSSISNGQDPETNDEIRRSYRKIVGTFDTLVSTQDYSNAVRTAENNDGELYVSNGLVTDRRNDYNQALNILTAKQTGTAFTNVALDTGKIVFKGALTSAPDDPVYGWTYYNTGESKLYIYTHTDNEDKWKEVPDSTMTTGDVLKYLDGMAPYDLIIYALQKYSEASYNSVFYWKALSDSFKQIDGDASNANTTIGIEDNLIVSLDEKKCINHTFRDLKTGQVYCFKNYLPLNVDIIPTHKVTSYERAEIINNIRKALSDNFNASKVEFGQELNYDEVKRVIEEADTRINYIRMSDFEYKPRVMLKNSTNWQSADEYQLNAEMYDGVSYIVDLAAKNILAGRLCLFNIDNNFDYEYGQVNSKVYEDILTISTNVKFKPDVSAAEAFKYKNTQLRSNEYLEILYPNYYAEKTYGSYVLYKLTLHSNTPIFADTYYKLKNGESLKVYYKSADGTETTETVIAGSVIKASFDLYNFKADTRTTYIKGSDTYKQIASNESISVQGLYSSVLNDSTYVYWIRNNSSNTLFGEDEVDTILSDGEYFIYTDTSKNFVTILGRGTKLSRATSGEIWTLPQSSITQVSLSQLGTEGLASKIPFVLESRFINNPLTITEMKIISLGDGCKFSMIAKDIIESGKLISANNIRYSLQDGTEITLPEAPDFYYVRARLDFDSSKDSPMILKYGQSITVRSNNSDSESILTVDNEGGHLAIQSNMDMHLIGTTYGGSSIDISMYSDLGAQINWMSYITNKTKATQIQPSSTTTKPGDIGWIYNRTNGEFKEMITPIQPNSPESGSNWFRCFEVQTDPNGNAYNISNPSRITLPFSIVKYEYLDELHDEMPDRQYICQIHLTNENETAGNVSIEFINADTSEDIDVGYYGNIGNNNQLINNKSVYVYPKITSTSIKNINLIIKTKGISGAVVTAVDPVVVQGINDYVGTGDLFDPTINRMTQLIENSSDSSVQFHWTNDPKSDIAMTTKLNDPYSMFDHNNVASIISIPEIDLETSKIDIIKSMRNY